MEAFKGLSFDFGDMKLVSDEKVQDMKRNRKGGKELERKDKE